LTASVAHTKRARLIGMFKSPASSGTVYSNVIKQYKNCSLFPRDKFDSVQKHWSSEIMKYVQLCLIMSRVLTVLRHALNRNWNGLHSTLSHSVIDITQRFCSKTRGSAQLIPKDVIGHIQFHPPSPFRSALMLSSQLLPVLSPILTTYPAHRYLIDFNIVTILNDLYNLWTWLLFWTLSFWFLSKHNVSAAGSVSVFTYKGGGGGAPFRRDAVGRKDFGY
jgi:hypothetical protein